MYSVVIGVQHIERDLVFDTQGSVGRGGVKVKSQSLQNMVIWHIKLKRMKSRTIKYPNLYPRVNLLDKKMQKIPRQPTFCDKTLKTWGFAMACHRLCDSSIYFGEVKIIYNCANSLVCFPQQLFAIHSNRSRKMHFQLLSLPLLDSRLGSASSLGLINFIMFKW